MLTEAAPLGLVTSYTHDVLGDLISVTADYGPGCGVSHLCQQVSMGYDAFGNVTALTDPKGNVTTTSYDLDRRPLTVTLPAAPSVLSTTTSYDQDGRVG